MANNEKKSIAGDNINAFRNYTTKNIFLREKEIETIKDYLKRGLLAVFSKNDNYVIINNETFNGYSRTDIDKILSDNMEDEC